MKPVPLSLSKKEKELLEAALHDEKNVRQWKRYKAILCRAEINNPLEVARIAGIEKRQLDRYVEAYRKNGISSLKIKKQTGRPSSIPEKKREKIVEIIDSNPYGWSTKQIQNLVYEKSGVKYSERHTYRLAQKWGFAEVVPRPKSKRQASKSTIYRFKKKQKKQ